MDVNGNVLLIAFRFPPENTSGAVRPAYFHRYLPAHGYRAVVISRPLPKLAAVAREVVRVPDERSRFTSTHFASKGCEWLQRILPYNEQLPWVPHVVAAGMSAIKAHPVRAIISTGPPNAPHLAAMWLKWRTGLPWVADFQDPLCGNPFRNRRFCGPYDRALEAPLFRRADALIANTAAVAGLWRERYPAAAEKIHVIMNGFDPADEVRPEPLPANGRVTIAHIGNLYGGRRPDRFLGAIDRLIALGRVDPGRIRAQFVGAMADGAMDAARPPFSNLIAKGCLETTTVRVPAAEARQVMAEAHYLLVLDVNDANVALQVPAKVYDYIRIGRPVLAFTPRNSPLESVIRRSGVAGQFVYPEDDDTAVERKILDLLALPAEPVRADAWFWNEFDARAQSSKLAGILDTVVDGKLPVAAREQCLTRS